MLSRTVGSLAATLASPVIMPAIMASIPRVTNKLYHRNFSTTPLPHPEEKQVPISEVDVKQDAQKSSKTKNSLSSTNKYFSPFLTHKRHFSSGFLRTPFLETKPKETHINNLLIKKPELPNSILITKGKLQWGYQALHDSVNGLIYQAIQAAFITPVLSSAWLFVISPLISDALLLATPSSLLESPVAMATLAVGGLFIAKNMMEVKRVNEYSRLSTIINPIGPSISEDQNAIVRQIVAGDKPKIKFNALGLNVSGPVGDINHPSPVLQNTIKEIHNKRRVVIPTCTLKHKADELVNLTTDRWVSRLCMPLSILNMAMIASKDSDKRTLDDYVVFAASANNVYDYMTGPSVAEAREKFTRMLTQCRNTEEVLRILIDHNIIDNGGMSFLKEWVKDQNAIGVRVGRDGSAILHKRTFSLGGPYPIKTFPEHDENEKTSALKPK